MVLGNAGVSGEVAQLAPYLTPDPGDGKTRRSFGSLAVIATRSVTSGRRLRGRTINFRLMLLTSKNPKVRFVEVKGTDHFALLAPTNELIGRQILKDVEGECTMTLSADEVNENFSKSQTAGR